jgi:uncharacterized membrane protein YdbT with pleckstrin-like domain
MEPAKLSGDSKYLFERIEFDNDERLICEIRKHPFGLFLRYLTGILVITVFSIVFFVLPVLVESDPAISDVEIASLKMIMAAIGFILIILAVIVTIISAYLYKSNVMLVTSEKIAQVLNYSLFNRKISQLSIGDVQDVTIRQDGFLPRIFGFGTIIVETAGEQQNYTFTYAPDPYIKSKAIVGTHEENLKKYGN